MAGVGAGAGVSQTLGWLSRISIEAETEMPRARRAKSASSRVLQLPFGLCINRLMDTAA